MLQFIGSILTLSIALLVAWVNIIQISFMVFPEEKRTQYAEEAGMYLGKKIVDILRGE